MRKDHLEVAPLTSKAVVRDADLSATWALELGVAARLN
jgi:hypothetical protein